MIGTKLVGDKLMVTVDGVECEVVVDSDALTRMSDDGRFSWNFQYIPKGTNLRLPFTQAPDAGVIARWFPDLQERFYQMRKIDEQKRIDAMAAAEAYDQLMATDEYNPEIAREKFLKEQELGAIDPESDWLWIKDQEKKEDEDKKGKK